MKPKLTVALEVATNTAYLLLVLSTLWILFPGIRSWLRRVAQAQLFTMQYGAYLTRLETMPAWKREALEVRGRAPRTPEAA